MIVIFNLGRSWRNPSKSHPIFLLTVIFMCCFLMSLSSKIWWLCFLFDYNGVISVPVHVEETDTH